MKLRIRQATVLDAHAAAAMKAAAWRESYGGTVPEEILERVNTPEAVEASGNRWAEAMADRQEYFWLVVDADADGEIVGVANAVPARDPDAPVPLELTMIYLLERAKGSGVADALLQHTIGDSDAYLWVLEDNPRARAFYARHGFVPDGVRKEAIEGTGVQEIRLVRRAADDD